MDLNCGALSAELKFKQGANLHCQSPTDGHWMVVMNTAVSSDDDILRHVPGGTTWQAPGPRITSKNFELRAGETGVSVSRQSITSPNALMAPWRPCEGFAHRLRKRHCDSRARPRGSARSEGLRPRTRRNPRRHREPFEPRRAQGTREVVSVPPKRVSG